MNCPDGVSLVNYLLLPDDCVPVRQRHDHSSASSLEHALEMLGNIGYSDEQLAAVRAHFLPQTQPRLLQDLPVADAAA